jgi:tetratricopeptide (TPR) repeat protein
MSTEPSDDSPEKSSATSISGGANINAQRDVNIGGDVVGRDKIMSAGDDIVMGDQVEAETYIEHATIVNDRTNLLWLAVLAGVVGVILIALSIIVTRTANTPPPVLTVIIPTNAPTETPAPNTPTPTATPIFAEKVLYRVAIAKFNQLSDRKLAIEQRLEDDLDQQLQAAGLEDEVDVKVVSQPAVESAEDAQKLAESTQSNVVIWGLYDDVGIRLRISLGLSASRSQAGTGIVRFGELPLASTGSETSTISFYITSTLPANTSFMSFYVIGHLYYLSNQYTKGHVAFDTAMQQLPKTVAVENEALLHFFNARVMDTTTLTGTVNAICEYAEAIAIDNQMFEAYDNMGILIANQPMSTSNPAVVACTQASGLSTIQPAALFTRALQIKPDLGIVYYNLAAFDWNTAMDQANPDAAAIASQERIKTGFETALKYDPSILAARLRLGNLAVWDGDYLTAVDYFSTALKLQNKSPEIMVNLGQALALAGRDSEAQKAYLQALKLGPSYLDVQAEAHFALGNLYGRQGKLDLSYQEYRQTEPYMRSVTNACTLQIALLKNDVQAGQWDRASERIIKDDWCPLEIFSWLIDGNRGITVPQTISITYSIASPPFRAWISGDVYAMVMYDLVNDCSSSSRSKVGSSESSTCVYDRRGLLDAILPAIERRIDHRQFFDNRITLDLYPASG